MPRHPTVPGAPAGARSARADSQLACRGSLRHRRALTDAEPALVSARRYGEARILREVTKKRHGDSNPVPVAENLAPIAIGRDRGLSLLASILIRGAQERPREAT